MASPDDMVGTAEVAVALGIAMSTVERMRRQGRGPKWTKVSGEIGHSGGRIRYKRADLDEYLKSRTVQPPETCPACSGPYTGETTDTKCPTCGRDFTQGYVEPPLPGLENSEIVGGISGEDLGLDPT